MKGERRFSIDDFRFGIEIGVSKENPPCFLLLAKNYPLSTIAFAISLIAARVRPLALLARMENI